MCELQLHLLLDLVLTAHLANATGAAEMTGITGRDCGWEENAMGAEPTETAWWPPGPKARKRG